MATLFGNARKSGGTLFGGSSSSLDPAAVQRQIDNASLRIRDSGYKVEDSDGRNFIERGLNLPKGQNAFFDVLEVLGRPAQGLLNVFDKSMADGTQGAGEAFMRGLSGKDRVRGSQLVEKAGVTDGFAKAVLGTGLEIVADPVSYVPGGVFVKGAKAVAKPVGALAKGSLNALENYSPTFKRAMDETIRPAATATKDRLGYMFDPDYKANQTLFGGESDFLTKTFRDTENKRRFSQEEYTDRILKTAQDTGLEQGDQVGRIMEAPLRQFEDVKGYEFPDGVRRTEQKTDLIDATNANREQIKGIGKEVRQTKQEYNSVISQSAQELEKLDKQIQRLYFKEERQAATLFGKRKKVPENIDELSQEKAFANVSASPTFNLLIQRRDELKGKLDSLRAESSTVNADKIAQIQKLNNEIESLKESVNNPVMIQKEIDRPARELSTDPKVQQAAENLMNSNAEIRMWAESEGIPISELEGYMTHVLSAEERKARKAVTPKNIDRSLTGMNQPNKSIMKQRELMGSAEDVNEQLGKKNV